MFLGSKDLTDREVIKTLLNLTSKYNADQKYGKWPYI